MTSYPSAMGVRRAVAAATAVGVLAAAAVAAADTSGGQRPPSPAGPIGHAGRWLTDATGRVVVTHGLDMVAKLPPYDPARIGFGADDAAFLARHGFTSVRLGVIWKRLEPAPGRFDDGYLRSLAATVALLARNGIRTLLDMHQDMWNERFQGEGAPDWAVDDDGLPAQPAAGFPGNYFAMPALWRAYDHFWADDAAPDGVRVQDAYAGAWRHVAAWFRTDAAVLGYDLFNEPFPGSQWYTCLSPAGCPVFDRTVLAPFVERVLHAIRTVDRTHLVFYEPQLSFDYSGQTWIGDPGDARSGFAFHDYCLAAVGVPESPPTRSACDEVEQRTLDNAEQQSASTGDALLLTEWGGTDDLAELSSMAARVDAQMVSWQEWTYVGGDPSGPRPAEGLVVDPARPPVGANVKWAKLAVLDRPHPLLVAGAPLGWSYDATSDGFAFSYSTRPVGPALTSRRTVVWTSPMHYPHGYVATASGATVVSRPDAARLVLVTDPGARTVVVRIRSR